MAAENDRRPWWSVVRYVHNPKRSEPVNIGLVVIRAVPNFGIARFLLPEALLSDRYLLLTTVMSPLGFRLPKEPAPQFQVKAIHAELPKLMEGAEEQTNHILFTQPMPAPRHQPLQLLREDFKRLVAPKS